MKVYHTEQIEHALEQARHEAVMDFASIRASASDGTDDRFQVAMRAIEPLLADLLKVYGERVLTELKKMGVHTDA